MAVAQSDPFHLVIPSMPGYGFFGQADPRPAWGPNGSRSHVTTLDERLGYKPFVAQGGDWGAARYRDAGRVLRPPELLGIHPTARPIPAELDQASLPVRRRLPVSLTEEKLVRTLVLRQARFIYPS